MAQTKAQKEKILKDLKEKITKQKVMFFVDFTGTKVKELSQLRKELKKVGGDLKVVKKTLVKIALEDQKMKFEKEKFPGEIGLVFAFEDEVSPAKTVYKATLNTKTLNILGGFFENQLKEKEEIITLAQIPSRPELLAKLVGTVSAPISGFANVLQGNIKGLLYALSAIKK